MSAIRPGDTVTVQFDGKLTGTSPGEFRVQTPVGSIAYLPVSVCTLKVASLDVGDAVTMGQSPNQMTVIAIDGTDVWVRKSDGTKQVVNANALTRV